MRYKIIAPSCLPVVASLAVLLFALGIVNWLHGSWFWGYLLFSGLILLLSVVCAWFRVAYFDAKLLNKAQYSLSDRTYRWSIFWFIFSELWFFVAFFGVLFYVRVISIPALSGSYYDQRLTHYLLWPSFDYQWPLLNNPDPSQYSGAIKYIGAWGLPAVNTAILLLSGVTITFSHWALVEGKKSMALIWQLVTALLGVAFLIMQFIEYYEAYIDFGLRLDSGVYGSVFFLLTGFHGFHVFLGTLMLIVIAFRIYYGHFSGKDHFAFEAVSWYWHFVDVVWLLLFIFVYWL